MRRGPIPHTGGGGSGCGDGSWCHSTIFPCSTLTAATAFAPGEAHRLALRSPSTNVAVAVSLSVFTSAGFFVEEQEAYELTGEGWRSVPSFDPQGVGYGDRGPAASAVLCTELSPGRLRRLATPGGLARTVKRRTRAVRHRG